jgi:hypothetical protein
VYANSDTIATTADNSRGLDATYGGTIVANDMKITTQGDHCAAIATDRGGGDISVTNSTLSTAGSGSPAAVLHRRHRGGQRHRHRLRQPDCRHGGPEHHPDL